MPFALTNAQAVFQNLVNDILRDFLNWFVFGYLDDILIFTKDQEEHKQHVRHVLQRLLKNKNCLSRQRNVSYTLTLSLFWVFVKRIKAVEEWLVPENQKQLQYFLGSCISLTSTDVSYETAGEGWLL